MVIMSHHEVITSVVLYETLDMSFLGTWERSRGTLSPVAAAPTSWQHARRAALHSRKPTALEGALPSLSSPTDCCAHYRRCWLTNLWVAQWELQLDRECGGRRGAQLEVHHLLKGCH